MPESREHPLYVSTRRLVKALDHLEGNLKLAFSKDSDDDREPNEQVMAFQQENAALKKERESLNQAIARLQRQYNDLHKVAENVYGKLDDSVKRLTSLIED